MKLHLLPHISTNLYMDIMKSCKAPTSRKVVEHLMVTENYTRKNRKTIEPGWTRLNIARFKH